MWVSIVCGPPGKFIKQGAKETSFFSRNKSEIRGGGQGFKIF